MAKTPYIKGQYISDFIPGYREGKYTGKLLQINLRAYSKQLKVERIGTYLFVEMKVQFLLVLNRFQRNLVLWVKRRTR